MGARPAPLRSALSLVAEIGPSIVPARDVALMIVAMVTVIAPIPWSVTAIHAVVVVGGVVPQPERRSRKIDAGNTCGRVVSVRHNIRRVVSVRAIEPIGPAIAKAESEREAVGLDRRGITGQ